MDKVLERISWGDFRKAYFPGSLQTERFHGVIKWKHFLALCTDLADEDSPCLFIQKSVFCSKVNVQEIDPLLSFVCQLNLILIRAENSLNRLTSTLGSNEKAGEHIFCSTSFMVVFLWKSNFKANLFSSTFLFERIFISKIALVVHCCTLSLSYLGAGNWVIITETQISSSWETNWPPLTNSKPNWE